MQFRNNHSIENIGLHRCWRRNVLMTTVLVTILAVLVTNITYIFIGHQHRNSATSIDKSSPTRSHQHPCRPYSVNFVYNLTDKCLKPNDLISMVHLVRKIPGGIHSTLPSVPFINAFLNIQVTIVTFPLVTHRM